MSLAAAFVAFNGCMYVALGIWCLVEPARVSQLLGFDLQNPSAKAEFSAVYGGLELGLGIFLLLAVFGDRISASMPGSTATLTIAVSLLTCLYAGLVMGRMLPVILGSSQIGSGWYFLIFEFVLLVISSLLLLKDRAGF